jgi:hypothetical protein
LEMLQQLGGFDAEGYRQVLWGMKLVPIAVSGKTSQLIAEIHKWIVIAPGRNGAHV